MFSDSGEKYFLKKGGKGISRVFPLDFIKAYAVVPSLTSLTNPLTRRQSRAGTAHR